MSSRSEVTVVAPTASTNGNPDDEEKMTGKSGGGEAGREDEVGDAGEISLEQVTDQWEIQFEPGERINPKNWGVGYRWFLTFASGLLTLNSTFSSSIPSGIANALQAEFPLEGMPVSVLCISLFLAGYVFGPIVWGPASEIWGRKPIFLYPYIIYTALQIANALVTNLPGLLIIRFFSGVFASVPISNAGAVLSDIWDVDRRGKAMSLFCLAPFVGPSIGPIISGFIEVSGTTWRWVFWITSIFAGCCTLLILFGIPETYPPKILAKKARRLRKETGEERWYAPLEKLDQSFRARVHNILFKPFIMVAHEPMLAAIILYQSVVYGIMYLLFPAFPFVFVVNHGFNPGQNGLVFLAIFAGGTICTIFFMTVIEPRYLRHVAAIAPQAVKPEKRLELSIICSCSLVISMFWFAWTSGPDVHWVSPLLAMILLGTAILGLFVSLTNYIVDVYIWSAATALAAATVVRSLFGAIFPLFASNLYENLGTRWASTVVGFIALALAPTPLILMKYGPAIRARSRYSANKIT